MKKLIYIIVGLLTAAAAGYFSAESSNSSRECGWEPPCERERNEYQAIHGDGSLKSLAPHLFKGKK